MRRVLTKKFFKHSAVQVAPALLGQFLVCKNNKGQITRLMITEVEAYDGFKDQASHAARGQTARNAPMWGPPGRWYVYLVYGNYFMLNIVTGPPNYPSAVLIRGVAGTKGPGRLTKQLKITKQFNNLPASKKSGLWLEDGGFKIKPRDVKKAPRIGIAYAGPVWSQKPWRFYLDY